MAGSVRSPSNALHHVDAGAFECVVLDRTVGCFDVDIEVRVWITPLKPRHRAVQVQSFCVIVNGERMMRQSVNCAPKHHRSQRQVL